MTHILGIPTTRLSDLLIQQRIVAQVQYNLGEMFKLETQLSTGYKFQLPGEEPVAALRVISLQRLLERKDQVKSNLGTTQSYLSATDSAASSISGIVAEIRAVGVAMMNDATVDDDQRGAAVEQVKQAIRQIMEAGNQKFRGRYLFAGSKTDTAPFRTGEGNSVEYLGDEGRLPSYCDVDVLYASNVTGSDFFGAISDPVRGSVDLNPVLNDNTRLADLRGGQGITLGSIAVSDGIHTSIVDLSTAETLGDVAALLRANPPESRSLDVDITATGLVIQLDSAPGNLSIREVGLASTADDLGILTQLGVGNNPIVGADLDPVLRTTTRLEDVFGVRARAMVRSAGPDNDLIFEADVRGETDSEGNLLNGASVSFVDDETWGSEWVEYTPSQDPAVPPTIVVHVQAGVSQASDVVRAVGEAHDLGLLPFTARLDPYDAQDDGQGPVFATPPGEAAGVTSGGSGVEFDQESGLQIVNGGKTYTISLASAETVQDVLNILNGSGIGVLAEINDSGTGIDLRSRLSGVDFAIGENGGATATQLGLRTFTTETRLDDLNYGRGVDRQEGVDLTIRLTDGTQLDIDLSTAQTIGDVLDLINTAAAGSLEARLSRYGNGIELVDENTGGQALSVIRTFGSNAAIDLGLVPAGNIESDPPTPGARAAAVWDDGSSANNELRIVANVDSSDYNGVTLRIHDDGGAVGHVPVLSYDAAGKVLDVEIENGVTTANDLIAELGNTPAVAALFTITNEGASTGDGTLSDADPAWSSVSLAGGQPETLTGADVHPLETEGLFTALLRMQQALEQHDLGALGRAINMLDACMLQTSFARAELGARQQGLDLLAERLDTEDTELRDTLSREYDVDFVEVTSRLTAQQTALQASLMSTGQVLQMTLLNYL